MHKVDPGEKVVRKLKRELKKLKETYDSEMKKLKCAKKNESDESIIDFYEREIDRLIDQQLQYRKTIKCYEIEIMQLNQKMKKSCEAFTFHQN